MLQVSLLEVQLGSSWYLEYLQQANKSNPRRQRRQLHRNVSESWTDINSGGLDMEDSLEAAVAAVVRQYRQDPSSAASGTAGSGTGLLDFLAGGSDGDNSAIEEMRIQQQQQQLLQQHLAAEPVYALARLRFGKNQYAESNPVRLRPGGAAVFREQFVFTTKRPLRHKHLVIEVSSRLGFCNAVCFRLPLQYHIALLVLWQPSWTAVNLGHRSIVLIQPARCCFAIPEHLPA